VSRVVLRLSGSAATDRDHDLAIAEQRSKLGEARRLQSGAGQPDHTFTVDAV
jgi:hypothetical protein